MFISDFEYFMNRLATLAPGHLHRACSRTLTYPLLIRDRGGLGSAAGEQQSLNGRYPSRQLLPLRLLMPATSDK
jgi:hypothetical protein